jgi:hypothetical protein
MYLLVFSTATMLFRQKPAGSAEFGSTDYATERIYRQRENDDRHAFVILAACMVEIATLETKVHV